MLSPHLSMKDKLLLLVQGETIVRYDRETSAALLGLLRSTTNFEEATGMLWQLLSLCGNRADNMPPRVRSEVLRILTGGTYECLVEDIDAAYAPQVSPLQAFGRVVERIIPAVQVRNFADFESVVPRLFQRLKERQAPLEWRVVHPQITATTRRMSRALLEDAFALQRSLGQSRYASYPVVLALEYPALCLVQSLYEDDQHGMRQLTVLFVVPRGFLRLTALPSYMLGYDGHDGLVWMQKGFMVRIGGLQLPSRAEALRDFMWYFTDYRWERRVACHPSTGVVMEHNSRLLAR